MDKKLEAATDRKYTDAIGCFIKTTHFLGRPRLWKRSRAELDRQKTKTIHSLRRPRLWKRSRTSSSTAKT